MITKPDILKMIKAVNRRSRGMPDRRLIHPRRDWGMVLTGVFIGAVGVVAFSGYQYLRFNSINGSISAETSQVTRYDANAVAQALELYAGKSAAFSELTAVAVPVIEEPIETATSTEASPESETTSSTQEDVVGVSEALDPPLEEVPQATEPPTLGF
jgi:hypothetical protein